MRARRWAASGFTLIELIVVLALVGLVSVLALPNLQSLYEGFTGRAEQGRLLNRLAGIGREAMLRQRAYAVYGTGNQGTGVAREQSLSGYYHYNLELPDGWEVSLDRPLLVRANGVCLGATVMLEHQGQLAARVVLKAPYCRVDADG